MSRIRGTGLGRGMAMGTAAIVRMRNGFPLLPPIPPRIAEQLSKRRLTEIPEVVLVAEDYRIALDVASSLRWARVVGIAAGTAPADAPISPIPVVVNLSGLLDMVRDDMLVMVDADHDMLVADPDGVEVAHYQAEREKIAPRRRLFLDDVHLPAETLDGRVIQILARVETEQEMALAVETGADMLYVPFNAPLLPTEPDDAVQRRSLLALLEKAGGKPLLLADEYTLAPMLLLEAALRSELTLAVPLQDHLDGLGLGELGGELNEAQADCLANEADCELPKLAVLLTLSRMRRYEDLEQMAVFMDRLALGNAIRIVLDTGMETYGQADLPLLDLVVAAANATMLPVILSYDPAAFESFGARTPEEDHAAQIRFLTGVGVSGIIVAPTVIQSIKADLRELNFSECREAISETLSRSL